MRPAPAALVLLFALAAPPLPAQAPGGDPLAQAEQLLAGGRTDEALRLAEGVLAREPKNARALLLRSTLRCMEGEIERCKADLDRALTLEPTLRQGWLNRSALAISERRYAEALAALVEAERLDPQAPDNALNQGAVLLLDGRLEPATEQFRRYLERNPRSADAFYLVASNYALSGYGALALQTLERAVAIDERQRARARVDPNFADLAGNPAFGRLLSTDGYQLPAGAAFATRTYDLPWRGGESRLLVATLNALQTMRWPLESRVEVAESWALIWSEARIKIARQGESQTVLELSAPPGRFSEEAWRQRTEALLSGIELELLRLERRRD